MKAEKEENTSDIQDPMKEGGKKANDISEEENGEYEGRNWNQILIGVVFILAVVILWYVFTR